MAETKTYQRPSSINLDVGKFYSCIKDDRTSLTVSMYGDRVYFNFFKYISEDKKMNISHFLNIDALIAFRLMLEKVASGRLGALNDANPNGYPEVEPIELNVVYYGKDQNVNQLGKIVIKTVDIKGVLRVAITGSDMSGNEITVVFGNTLVTNCITLTPSYKTLVDTFDLPFFRFCYVLKEIENSQIIYAGFNKLAGLITRSNGTNLESSGKSKFGFFGGKNREGDSNKMISSSTDPDQDALIQGFEEGIF